MKIYNIIQIPKGLSQEMECDCREEYYSGMTAGEEAQKAKLVSTAITENGTYVQEDGFSQVDVNVVKPEIYFPMNPRTVGADSRKGIFFPIFVTGCTIDPTDYTLKAVGDVVSNISELHGNNGTYYVDVDITANPTDKTRIGYIQGAFTDTDGVMHAVKPCIVSQNPGTENQDYNSGYTAGFDDGLSACTSGSLDLKANLQGDYYIIPEGTTKLRYGALQNCNISAITIPSSVLEIGALAFLGNPLTSITIPSSVYRIEGRAFEYTRLEEITIPDSVIYLGGAAFLDCKNLTAATLPSNLTSIDDLLFEGCALTGITLPTGIKSIGRAAFENCPLTGNIVIPSGVTSIEATAFRGCSGLTSMTFESPVPATIAAPGPTSDSASLGDSAYTWPIYVPCEAVEEYRTAWPYYAHRISCPDLPKMAPVSVNEDTPDTGNDENTSSSATDNIPK